MKPLLNGTVYSRSIKEWTVKWESYLEYRYWCHQVKDSSWDNLLVVMFNPGSLNGKGDNLKKDTTLRILREVCVLAFLNPFIINLFDYSTPSPQILFHDWEYRDSTELVYDKLDRINFSAFIMAYGDYENNGQQVIAIKKRISLVRKFLKNLPEIKLPKNKSGTPKHPMAWQRQKIKPLIATQLRKNT